MFNSLQNIGASFLPVQKNKTPSVVGGITIGVTSATDDANTISEWLKLGHGIAVAGGLLKNSTIPLYLVELDIDVKKEDGKKSLAALEAKYGKLPETYSECTPSGGEHLFFISEQEIGSLNNAFERIEGYEGIDIKGLNGYCVCSPTEGYKATKDIPVAKLPTDWVLLLKSIIEVRKNAKSQVTFSIPRDPDLVRWFNQKVPIRDMLLKLGYTQTSANSFCHPDGATSERNVFILPNHNMLQNDSPEISWHYGSHDKVKKGPHDSYDLLRIRDYNGSWDDIRKVIREGKNNDKPSAIPSANGNTGVNFIGGYLDDIEREVPLCQEELIFCHCHRNERFFIAGKSEAKKTFWLMHMAFSLATGIPFLGAFQVRTKDDGSHLKSLMILTESEDCRQRVDAWVKYYSEWSGRTEADLRACIKENIFFLFKRTMMDKGDTTIEEIKTKYNFHPDFIGIDHLSNCLKGDENSNPDAANFLEYVRCLALENNAVVAIVHHPSKSGEKIRGASAFYNNIRIIFNIDQGEMNVGNKKNEKWVPNGIITVNKTKGSAGYPFRTYTIESKEYALYPDTGSVVPGMMRTGLAIYCGLDPSKLPSPQHHHGIEDDLPPLTTEEEETPPPTSSTDEDRTLPTPAEKGHQGRPKSDIPDKILYEMKNSKYSLDWRELMELVGCNKSQITYALGILQKEGRIEQFQSRGKSTRHVYKIKVCNKEEPLKEVLQNKIDAVKNILKNVEEDLRE